jgi:hypothetical protein
MERRIIVNRDRLVCVLSAACVLHVPGIAGSVALAGATGESPKPAMAAARPGRDGTPAEMTLPTEPSGPRAVAPETSSDGARKPAIPRIEVNSTELRTSTPAVPGAILVLEADARLHEGTHFQWLQVEGPPVEIRDSARPAIHVKVPAGGDRLAFVLVAARPERTIVNRIVIPLQPTAAGAIGTKPAPDEKKPRGAGKIQADAGDDQVGLVGHRVTLNGSRSVPAHGNTARWLQISGPPAVQPQRHGPFFSFVPTAPGLYRFMLVVAGGDEVPDADDVTVLVGSPPVGAGLAAPSPAAMSVAPPASAPATTLDKQALSASVSRLANGRTVAGQVADALQAISERMDLYSSFAELQQELARRLEVVIPAEPAQRAAWNEGVFAPLTTYTSGQLSSAGLDVLQPRGLDQRLSAAQRERLHDHFQSLAQVFRAASTAR